MQLALSIFSSQLDFFTVRLAVYVSIVWLWAIQLFLTNFTVILTISLRAAAIRVISRLVRLVSWQQHNTIVTCSVEMNLRKEKFTNSVAIKYLSYVLYMSKIGKNVQQHGLTTEIEDKCNNETRPSTQDGQKLVL